MRAVRWALACVCAAGVCGATEAFAQARPYRALFGGAASDPTAHHLFDVTFSVAEAHDTNVLAKDGAQTGPKSALGGFFTAMSADLRYVVRGRRAELAANAGSNVRYFQDLGEFASMGHYVGVGLSTSVGRRTTFSINEAASYTPAYLYGLFASAFAPAVGEVVPSAPNYAVSDRRSYTSATDTRLTREIGRRSSIDFNGGYRITSVTTSFSGTADVKSYEVGSHWRRPVTRDLALRLGYTHRQAEYSNGRRPVTEDIDIGVDYDRPLSRDRRTKLKFNVGTSLLDAPPPLQTVGSVKQLRTVGNVLLTHQFGRTWSARLGYRRSAMFLEELTGPAFMNGVTFTSDGFLSRRTDLTTSMAYSAGDTFGASGTFETYTGNARLRVAANHGLAVFAEYLYYFYRFDRGIQLISGAPPELRRNSVRIGLTFWAPLLRK